MILNFATINLNRIIKNSKNSFFYVKFRIKQFDNNFVRSNSNVFVENFINFF